MRAVKCKVKEILKYHKRKGTLNQAGPIQMVKARSVEGQGRYMTAGVLSGLHC